MTRRDDHSQGVIGESKHDEAPRPYRTKRVVDLLAPVLLRTADAARYIGRSLSWLNAKRAADVERIAQGLPPLGLKQNEEKTLFLVEKHPADATKPRSVEILPVDKAADWIACTCSFSLPFVSVLVVDNDDAEAFERFAEDNQISFCLHPLASRGRLFTFVQTSSCAADFSAALFWVKNSHKSEGTITTRLISILWKVRQAAGMALSITLGLFSRFNETQSYPIHYVVRMPC